MNPKQLAAERAVSYVQNGMTVGLGTGSTAALAIAALGERLRRESLRIDAIGTSIATEHLARAHAIPLIDWDCARRLDLCIDGADEVDPAFRLIKGGGGALVREKIAASAADIEIIIVDPSKVVPALGAFALPIAVLPYGWQCTRDRLEERFQRPVFVRKTAEGQAFVSDDSLRVLDMAFGAPLPSPDTLESEFKQIVGVVEVGLFVGLCQRLIIGHPDGTVEERTPPVS